MLQIGTSSVHPPCCPQPAGNTCCHLLWSTGNPDQIQQRKRHSCGSSHFLEHPSSLHIDILPTTLPFITLAAGPAQMSPQLITQPLSQTSLGLLFHDGLPSASSSALPSGSPAGTWKHKQTLALSLMTFLAWGISLLRSTSLSCLSSPGQVLVVTSVPGSGIACCPAVSSTATVPCAHDQ